MHTPGDTQQYRTRSAKTKHSLNINGKHLMVKNVEENSDEGENCEKIKNREMLTF